MYQLVLARKYLTSRIMPTLALLAVMLSVATVTVTWSVMGGFLNTLIQSGRSLVGDVSIDWPNTGFAHYEDLIARLEADAMIAAATPVIETFGMVRLPDDQVRLAVLKGVEGESFARVTNYEDTLYWRPVEPDRRKQEKYAGKPEAFEHLDPRAMPDEHPFYEATYANGLRLRRPESAVSIFEQDGELVILPNEATEDDAPAIVPGVEFTNFNYRTAGGFYQPKVVLRATSTGGVLRDDLFMPIRGSATVTVLQLDSSGRPADAITRTFPVANEFQSGIFEADQQVVLVEFHALQQMMNMDAAERPLPDAADNPFAVSEDGAAAVLPGRTEIDPARTTTVLVRGVDGIPAAQVARRVETIYGAFYEAHPGEVPDPLYIRIQTWEDMNRTMIEAVKKETGLVLVIFGIICFTTVFLVLAIFWSMISEKTKDIGVLRAIGAGRAGIASLWLSYGMGLGIVGAVLGTVLAALIVANINEIHTAIGQAGAMFGMNTVIWDPRIYYFATIPTDLDPVKAAVVVVMGILTCVLGAAIPSIRAARMDPVQALRFE